MKMTARVENWEGALQVQVRTGDAVKTLSVPPKPSGFGASVNGFEMLCFALAACYCNDLYREAGKRGIHVEGVEVEAEMDFFSDGDAAKNVTYRVKVTAGGSEADIRELLEQTDRAAEVHNTLRAGVPVTLGQVEIHLRPQA